MQSPSDSDERTSDPWRALVAGLSQAADRLASEYLVEIEHGDRYYDGRVEASDLRDSATKAFRYLLGSLLVEGVDPELADFPADVGARRARQGVGLENLVTAIRSDFMVVWNALREAAGESDLPVLIANVDQLWRAVDDFAAQVHVGYMNERIALARTRIDDQHELLARLFQSAGPGVRAAESIARGLDLDPDAGYWVIAGAAGEHLDDSAGQLAVAGHRHYVHLLRGQPVLLLPATGQWQKESAVEALGAGTACAVGPRAARLSDVYRSAEVALLMACETTGLATVRTGWTRLSLSDLAAAGEALRDHVLAPLDGSPDRDMLLHTVEVFARHGAVADAAEELYCHRNTVLNRLRKFQDLTGLDVTRPQDTALALVALLRP